MQITTKILRKNTIDMCFSFDCELKKTLNKIPILKYYKIRFYFKTKIELAAWFDQNLIQFYKNRNL